jgi:hypothetical protein
MVKITLNCRVAWLTSYQGTPMWDNGQLPSPMEPFPPMLEYQSMPISHASPHHVEAAALTMIGGPVRVDNGMHAEMLSASLHHHLHSNDNPPGPTSAQMRRKAQNRHA